MEVAPLYDEFKHQINSTLFTQNVELDQQVSAKQQQMKSTEQMVRQLKAKQSQLKWTIHRNDKQQKLATKKQQEQEYAYYQQHLRQQFLEFVREKTMLEKKEKSVLSKEKVLEQRLQKMKTNALYRLELIDEFKATLDHLEWTQQIKSKDGDDRKARHEEFVERLREEKMFKQEIYAIEKIVEFEQRKVTRQQEMDFKHQQLLKEQQEVMKNIEYMLKSQRQ